MGVRHGRWCLWREMIPTRFARCTRKPTSPFQGEVKDDDYFFLAASMLMGPPPAVAR